MNSHGITRSHPRLCISIRVGTQCPASYCPVAEGRLGPSTVEVTAAGTGVLATVYTTVTHGLAAACDQAAATAVLVTLG